MKREFMHFMPDPKAKEPKKTMTPEEFADMFEEQLRKMIEDGEEYCELRIDIPDNLTPEQAATFVEEIIKRLNDEGDDE
ncbi:hypothetical protein GAP32_441 [Cronobacter phage vB_CsaM_GAP32]|uniref:Uncharacterized protein n=1 Tax=Cronobacter phage vB_CsaM_GAP32 TaxID=1141136 RepID=K4F6K6_9CAUD|nr:hypothetical protein GAP32_441 [Cronobacter phage vB_CsaM_GAP32]AFC21896.1 hypothetical protein GAP32_441 [Cronobacter phage vB_CsaM_GAP32]